MSTNELLSIGIKDFDYLFPEIEKTNKKFVYNKF